MKPDYTADPILLPDDSRRRWSPKSFVAKLRDVVLDAARIRYGPNTEYALRNSLLAASSKRKSMNAIANDLGITSQGARDYLNTFFCMLRRTMLQENYFGCHRVRFRSEFLEPLQVLAGELWNKDPLCESDWNALILREWRMQAAELEDVEALLLAILGLRRFDFERCNLRPIITSQKKKTQWEGVVRVIDQLLSQNPAGLALERIVDGVQRVRHFRDVDRNTIEILLRSMRGVRSQGGLYRMPAFLSRASRADQYHAILTKAGKPLHYRELIHRLRRLGYGWARRLPQAVSNILSVDERFIAVVPHGFWALATWKHIETRTIADTAFDEITKANRPLHQDELYSRIAVWRALKKNSIENLLSADVRFRRVAPRCWDLAQ